MSRSTPLTDEERNRILDEYKKGVPKKTIANKLGHGKQTVVNVIRRAIALGMVEETVCPKYTYKKPNKEITRQQAIMAQIIDGYNNNETYECISKKMNISVGTVQKYVNIAIDNQLITPEDAKKRNSAKRPEVHKADITLNKPQMPYVSVPSTLAEGETVRCTKAVSATCVYGCANGNNLCRYSMVTGKCRSIGKNGCSWKSCTKYSRIGKSNPRLKNRSGIDGEEEPMVD